MGSQMVLQAWGMSSRSKSSASARGAAEMRRAEAMGSVLEICMLSKGGAKCGKVPEEYMEIDLLAVCCGRRDGEIKCLGV